jgi:prepilin-type N-terminal cleavage/methylation domain-containing protein
MTLLRRTTAHGTAFAHHSARVRPFAPQLRVGFTLIELLMVVIVVGLMMAVVLPKFRISPETEVQLAAMQVAQDIDLARTRALSTRSSVRVDFQPSGRNYTGYLDLDDDGTIGGTRAERDALRGFATRTLQPRVEFGRGAAGPVAGDPGSGAITVPNNSIEFDSRGLSFPMGTGGVIYVTHQDTKSAVGAVAISPAGNVRLWTFRNGVWE